MRLPATVAAVIFDCDGTLVDSEPITNGLLATMLSECGIGVSMTDVARAFRESRTLDLHVCLTGLAAHHGRTLADDFIPRYRLRMAAAFRTGLRPIDGALELVRDLPLPKCVASSGTRARMELTLSLTGLLPFFEDRVYSSYDIGSWKPAPDLFLHAARALHVDPSQCVVIEDSLPGALAGVAAGMTVFVLQTGDVDGDLPSDVTVVRSLHEIRHVFHLG